MCGVRAGGFNFHLSTSNLDPSCCVPSPRQQMLPPPQAMTSLYFRASLRSLRQSFSLLIPRCGAGKAETAAGTPSCCLLCRRGWAAARGAREGGWGTRSRGSGVWGPGLNERPTLSRPRLAVHPFILPGSQGARQHPAQNTGTLSS